MKKFIFLILAIILGAGIYFGRGQALAVYNQYMYYSPCDAPLGYSTGELDPRFGYSEEQFRAVAGGAAEAWNKAYGQNLLAYDPKATLTINLIFDERQSLLSEVEEIKTEVEKNEKKLTPTIAEFDRMKADFLSRQNAFNDKVIYWNQKGGAPEDEYEKLNAEQKQLREEADKLNATARSLNQSAAEYNAKVATLNKAAHEFNSTLDEKPEGGIYDPRENRIEAYYGSDREELRRILTHEMGHALGLGHSASADDIMYYKFSRKTSNITTEDLKMLADLCRPQSVLIILQEELSERARIILSRYF